MLLVEDQVLLSLSFVLLDLMKLTLRYLVNQAFSNLSTFLYRSKNSLKRCTKRCIIFYKETMKKGN